MEAPRSRKVVALSPPHIPILNGDTSCCEKDDVTNGGLLLPRTSLEVDSKVILPSKDVNTNEIDGAKRPVRRGFGGRGSNSIVIWLYLIAVGVVLLVTIMLSLKVFRPRIRNADRGFVNHDHVNDLIKQRRLEDQRQQQLLQLQSRETLKTAMRPTSARIRAKTTNFEGLETSNSYADLSLKGLLADFKEYGPDHRCASRGQRPTTYIPTKFLTQKLREYESLHRRCAGYAASFSYDIPWGTGGLTEDCHFIVWIANSGLGNRLLSMASAFLYALLTNRVLLVDTSMDMSKLFCEPFPGTSWLLPAEFPLAWLRDLNETSQFRFGEQFKHRVELPSPAFSYIHLTHSSNEDDSKFFCDHGQDYLRSIPWLFMKANNYIVPGLFFISSFGSQLEWLFPEKESVFHLLSKYLFHPANAVWLRINRIQVAYLAARDKQVGIQIRTFNDTPLLYHFEEQLFRCALENKILPNVFDKDLGLTEQAASGNSINPGMKDSSKGNSILSILVTSLQSRYSERLRDFFLSAPAENGHIVAVHQVSVEGWQREDSSDHDLKAWADILLLSESDDLITSGWSTFGYVAQSLAGVKPWILFRSFDATVPDPPCIYARSIEPCFHQPPFADCDSGAYRDPSKVLPFVQSCEDVAWGIKLIDPVNVVKQ